MSSGDDRGADRSWWMQQALARESRASRTPTSLDRDARCSVCIVGGGYTGLWTALWLKDADPESDVVVIEAGICGSGASGRNGGFATTWWEHVESLEHHIGRDQALFLCRASSDSLRELERFCRDHEIEGDFRLGGELWASAAPAQDGTWNETVDSLGRLGEPERARVLSAEECRRRTGSPILRGGVLFPDAASVQPALLVRGLRRVALERGVRLFEHTPMVALERRSKVVVTPAGRISADRIVIAMNAWAARLPEIQRIVLPVSSHIVLTEPVPDEIERLGWTGGELLVDGRMMIHYTHVTSDSRIAFGRGGGAIGFRGRIGRRVLWDPALARTVEADFRRFFPSLANVRIDAAWGGAVDRAWRHLPFFSRLGDEEDIFVGAGYSGDGVLPSRLGGRILASLALGRRDEWATCGLTAMPDHRRFPPEPLRKAGGEIVRAAVARKEAFEEQERTPDLLTSQLARLAWFALPTLPSYRSRQASR